MRRPGSSLRVEMLTVDSWDGDGEPREAFSEHEGTRGNTGQGCSWGAV
jgi:hypothetical protein